MFERKAYTGGPLLLLHARVDDWVPRKIVDAWVIRSMNRNGTNNAKNEEDTNAKTKSMYRRTQPSFLLDVFPTGSTKNLRVMQSIPHPSPLFALLKWEWYGSVNFQCTNRPISRDIHDLLHSGKYCCFLFHSSSRCPASRINFLAVAPNNPVLSPVFMQNETFNIWSPLLRYHGLKAAWRSSRWERANEKDSDLENDSGLRAHSGKQFAAC